MIRILFTGTRGGGKTVLAKAVARLLKSEGVSVFRSHEGDDDLLHIDNDFNPSEFIASPAVDTVERIRQWAHDRNLIDVQTSHPQVTKLYEEGGEVAAAVARQDRDALKDGIGDMVVVLVILAAQNGLTFEECVAAAYDEIKDRKGRMVDGVFVREQ